MFAKSMYIGLKSYLIGFEGTISSLFEREPTLMEPDYGGLCKPSKYE